MQLSWNNGHLLNAVVAYADRTCPRATHQSASETKQSIVTQLIGAGGAAVAVLISSLIVYFMHA